MYTYVNTTYIHMYNFKLCCKRILHCQQIGYSQIHFLQVHSSSMTDLVPIHSWALCTFILMWFRKISTITIWNHREDLFGIALHVRPIMQHHHFTCTRQHIWYNLRLREACVPRMYGIIKCVSDIREWNTEPVFLVHRSCGWVLWFWFSTNIFF